MRVGNEFQANSTTGGDQLRSKVAVLADGRMVIIWDSQDGDSALEGIRARILEIDGTRPSNDFIVNLQQNDVQVLPSLIAMPDGRFVAIWRGSGVSGDGDGPGLNYRIFNSSGTGLSDELKVNTTITGQQTNPAGAALPDGRFFVVWQADSAAVDGSGAAVMGRFFRSNGLPDTSINSGNDFIIATSTVNNQQLPVVAALPGDRYIVTWRSNDAQGADTSDFAIRARIFNADGTATPDFIVNTQFLNGQVTPSVSVQANGTFLIAWHSADLVDDTSGSGIRARLFNSDGSPVGDDFLVNSTTSGNQSNASVAALADGRFVVVWQSPEGGNLQIRARLISETGSAIGADFVINAVGTNDQSTPSVAAIADGRFIVTWHSNDGTADVSGFGIRGQIFDPKIFMGTDGNDNWIGGALADTISGDDGADVLRGGAGNDIIRGGEGNDTLFGDAGNDLLFGDAGADILRGGPGRDRIYGGFTFEADTILVLEGDDVSGETYHAGGGTVLLGGTDGDYRFNLSDDTLISVGKLQFDSPGSGGGQTATARIAASQLRRVDLNAAIQFMEGNSDAAVADRLEIVMGGVTDANFAADGIFAGYLIFMFQAKDRIVIIGDESSETITGTDFHDIFISGGGTDVFNGRAGDDTYELGSNASVTISDSAGNDTVTSTITRSLASFATIENLTLTGTGKIDGTGNALANFITGNAKNNVLDGGKNADTLKGLAGNDTYVVDNAGDVVDETGGSGIDTVLSSVTFSLADTVRAKGAVENLTLTGNGKINATGNKLANVIVGNARDNRIEGGEGKDTTTGGGGNDTFVFTKVRDSGMGTAADVILDFDDAGNDRIDLSAFAGTFSYIHDAAFSAKMQVRAVQKGGDVILQINTGGSLAPEFEIRLAKTSLASMGIDDFIL